MENSPAFDSQKQVLTVLLPGGTPTNTEAKLNPKPGLTQSLPSVFADVVYATEQDADK